MSPSTPPREPLRLSDLITRSSPESLLLSCRNRKLNCFSALFYDRKSHTYGLIDLPDFHLNAHPAYLARVREEIFSKMQTFSAEELHQMVLTREHPNNKYSPAVRVLLQRISDNPDLYLSPTY